MKHNKISTYIGIIAFSIGFLCLLMSIFFVTRSNTTLKPSYMELPSFKDDGKLKEYYSPNLDLVISYSPLKYTVSDDSTGYVSIHSARQLPIRYLTGIYTVVKPTEKDVIKYIVSNLETTYGAVNIDKQENIRGGITQIEVSYTSPDLTDTKIKVVSRATYLIRKLDDRYIYTKSNCIGCKENYLSANEINDYSKVLNSIKTPPAGFSPIIRLGIEDAEVSYSLDRKRWNFAGQNVLSHYLTYRDTKSLSESLQSDSFTNLDIVAVQERNVTLDRIKSTISEEISSLKSNNNPTAVVIVDPGSQEQYGKLTFAKYSFTRKSLGNRYLVTKYFVYNEKTGYLITMVLSSDNQNTSGYKDGISVIHSIEFGDVKEQIQGIENTSKVLGTSTNQINVASLLGLSSVVHIFNKSCVNIDVKADNDLPLSGGKAYLVCTGGFGTGWFVNGNGYVITNSHVSKPNALDVALNGLFYNNDYARESFWGDYGRDINTILVSKGISTTDEQFVATLIASFIKLSQINSSVFSINRTGVITLTPKYTNYVSVSKPFVVDSSTLNPTDPEKYTEAHIVAGRDIDSLYDITHKLSKNIQAGILKPDITLLKTGLTNTPSLVIENWSTVMPGQEISAVGFPGLADNTAIFSEASSATPTLTKGTISAIKTNFDGTFKMIQIDASISHGNSGGPIINNDGKVVGVATYGLSEQGSADFNVGISSEEVQKLIKEKGVGNLDSPVGLYIAKGGTNYEKGYFKWALRDWESAVKSFPQVEEILDPLMASANEKIKTGQDKTPLFTIGTLYISVEILFTSTIGLIVMIIGIIIISKRHKRPIQVPVPC